MSWEVRIVKLQNSSKAISRIIKENLRKFWVIPLIGGIIMFLAGPNPEIGRASCRERV